MAVIDTGSSSSGKANVDSNYNLNVVTPSTNTQAGFTRQTYLATSTIAKDAKVTEEGLQYMAEARQLLDIDFNSASTAWNGKLGTNATTMTKAVQNGFMRLNNSAITTTTTGIAIYSNRTINIESGYEYVVSFQMRHTNATATNKQAEFGLGYYAFAAGQAAQMNEFIGFRFKTDGTVAAVVGTTTGGAPSETETTLAGFPGSDATSREYKTIITEKSIEFWIDGVYQTRITKPTTFYSAIKAVSYPFIARVFNSGAASAAATFDISNISVMKVGADDGMPHPFRMAAMDKSAYYAQPDVLAAATATHNSPATGAAPTAATGSNTASVLNNTAQMGGLFSMNAASLTTTNNSNILISAYQNPAMPTAAGAATNARNLYVTAVMVSPMVVTTVIAGQTGNNAFQWLAWIGQTATSLATADADGTTAVAQKAPRLVPLGLVSQIAANAAAGVVTTDVGNYQYVFPTPLVIHPGEFIAVGVRQVLANTVAASSGVLQGSININGYWD